ncbi:MAG: UDP-N-acetylmuramoyl-tripeptide--D-alanyl-D-alanine ligase [Spirochaetaceae bacterium]|nr:UDP-N-acetylmuramoyl-tripeptide--D-alanyl-D-alanine ligase [Spirochaetaceae bacterium]
METEYKENLLTFDELRQAGFTVESFGAADPRFFSSVCVDSRKARKGSLFVALRGEKADGHDFAADAINAGAAGIVIERGRGDIIERAKGRCHIVLADDTLNTLQKTAALYVSKFDTLFKIGITGSSGKTTAKEICASIFAQEKKVIYNEGNLNSDTGLPLAVFTIRKEHETGIFEMGMNRKGEMAEIAAVLKPDIALITNIGSAHIGILGSLENIAREKQAVCSQFTGSQTLLVPQNVSFQNIFKTSTHGRVVFYDTLDTFTGTVENAGLNGSTIRWDGFSARFPLAGTHNAENALAALALARECGVSGASIAAGLESVKPLFGRAEVLRTYTRDGTGYTLVRDCYNANPESMEKALDFCDEIKTASDSPAVPRKLYIIGAMRELGKETETEHRKLGKRLAVSGADAVFLFGEETEISADILHACTTKKNIYQTNDIDELIRAVRAEVHKDDLILLKGSRSCGLERVEKGI